MFASQSRDEPAYLRFLSEPVATRQEIWPGVVMEYAADGRLVGIMDNRGGRSIAQPSVAAE